tara:strand:- start:1967 stop:2398 length:432 start_codon:yes stop_codon:yes gene_type:complete
MEGFLPRKGQERDARLESVASDERTTVIFESPKRLRKTLTDLSAVCGADRQAAVLRELTKLFEETVRGTLAELSERFDADVKGEIVIVVSPAPVQDVSDEAIVSALEAELIKGATKSSAVSQVAANLKAARNRVYSLAHEIRK